MTDREQDFEQQPGPQWRMKISREREIYAEPMLDAENIRREFGCSRSKAYEHLHAALAHFGIVPEAGKQLRIRWSLWQRYKESRIPWARAATGSPSVDTIWYAHFFESGVRRQVSTHCTDLKAAELKLRQLERDGADPAHAASQNASLSAALRLLIDRRTEEAIAGRRSHETVAFYRRKAGHLTRIFEYPTGQTFQPFLLKDLQPSPRGQLHLSPAIGSGE